MKRDEEIKRNAAQDPEAENAQGKKKVGMRNLAPALSALLVVACAGASIAAYTPTVYAVQEMPETDSSEDLQEEVEAVETALESQVFDLPDGIYEGTGTGYAGKITVAVEIKDKKIVSITVLNVEADDAAFFNRAKAVIDRIIAAQNLDVDVVSGATYSSRGIISAVKNALTGETDSGETAADSQSQGQGSTTVAEVADASEYRDGTYYGSATGFAGPIKVKVVIEGGKIASIEIVSTSDGSSYISKASSIMNQIVSTQSTNVDTVSGATYSSVGIINAVRNALAQAAVSGGSAQTLAADESTTTDNTQNVTPGVSGNFPYPDGTYYGTAEGYNGDVTVAVVIRNQTIQEVNIVDNVDDPAFFNRALAVKNSVVSKQSTDVDIVSGATYSSNGILNAIKAALESAKAAADPSVKPANPDSGKADNSDKNNNNHKNDANNVTKEASYYADGEYTVTVPCEPDDDEDFDTYNLTVTVVVKGDRITGIKDVSGDGNDNNKKYIGWATEGRNGSAGMASIVTELESLDMTESGAESQMNANIDKLDTVSRATCSSNSIKEACKLALTQARAAYVANTKDNSDGSGDQGNTDAGKTDSNTGNTDSSKTDDGKKDDADGKTDGKTDDADSKADDKTDGKTDDTDSKTDGKTDGESDGSDNAGDTGKSDADEKAAVYCANGEYTVTVPCEPDEDEDFESYNLTMTVVINGDRITGIKDISGDGDSDNDKYIGYAVDGRIIKKTGVEYIGLAKQAADMAAVDMTASDAEAQFNAAIDGLDTVSGATCSSNSIKEACKLAVSEAHEAFLASASADSEESANVQDQGITDETASPAEPEDASAAKEDQMAVEPMAPVINPETAADSDEDAKEEEKENDEADAQAADDAKAEDADAGSAVLNDETLPESGYEEPGEEA